MKKTIIIILIAICFHGFAQKTTILNKPSVDKRVELLSIVFRLAEKPEYTPQHFKLYTDKIENQFGKQKNHELIRFVKSIMYNNGIGYDAVMSMAIHLDKNLNLLTGVTTTSLDERWSKENAEKFVSLLKKFSKDTNYDQFYKDNAGLYAEAGKRFLPVYEQVDLNWYTTFYGKAPTETFLIVNGLGNGGNNYGPSLNYKNGKKDVYAIVGTWRVDNTGMPEFRMNEYFLTLLHEFNHSFVNYLTDKNEDALKNSGEQLFAVVKEEMSSQAYGTWKTMMNEALVRASVIKYMKDHNFDKQETDSEIKRQVDRGFLWIKELVSELENYDKQRNLYPTLEDYMPKLTKAYDVFAKNVQQFDSKRPRIISIKEFTNGDTEVNAATKTITMNFDKPLSGKGFSVFLGRKGKEAFPVTEDIIYGNNNQSVIMMVKLEKDKEYQFIMKGEKFTSVDGVGMKDYEVNFKTGK